MDNLKLLIVEGNTKEENSNFSKAGCVSQSENFSVHIKMYEPNCEIDVIVEGEAAKIAFNGKYLIDALSVLHETQVALETTNPSSPGVLRPVGVDNYIHVVMPMFVQW